MDRRNLIKSLAALPLTAFAPKSKAEVIYRHRVYSQSVRCPRMVGNAVCSCGSHMLTEPKDSNIVARCTNNRCANFGKEFYMPTIQLNPLPES